VLGFGSFTLPNPDIEAGQDGDSSDDDDDEEAISAEAAETSSHREMRRIAIRDELLELRSLQERAHNMGRDSGEEESSV
jgi:TATA-binding protein-associated factor Taf7